MKAIPFENADDLAYGAPENWNEERDGHCRDLIVKREEDGCILSVWELTAHERWRIYRGANVALRCFKIQPPVKLAVVTLGAKMEKGPNFSQQTYKDDGDGRWRSSDCSLTAEEIRLFDEDWKKLNDSLSARAKPIAHLNNLLNRPSIWDENYGDCRTLPKLTFFARIKRAIFGVNTKPVA